MKTATTALASVPLLTLAAIYAPYPAPAPPAPAPLAAGGPTPILSVPETITTPGSYCLTGNLTAGPGEFGIRVTCRDVVIDLGGFTLRGPGITEGGIGIHGVEDHVVVRNGTLADWGVSGVTLVRNSSVEDVQVRQCARGISFGSDGRAEGCWVQGALLTSINAGHASRVIDCWVEAYSASTGVQLGINALAKRVKVGGGDMSFSASSGARFEDCSAWGFKHFGFRSNDREVQVIDSIVRSTILDATAGIDIGDRGEVRGCQVSGPVEMGIVTGFSGEVLSTTVRDATSSGITAGRGTRVKGCRVESCGSAGAGVGLTLEGENFVADSIFAKNDGMGLLCNGEGGRVEGCSAYENTSHGLQLGSDVVAVGNHVWNNGGTGISVQGHRVRLQDNEVNSNGDGILLSGSRSLLTGNRAAQNTGENYDLPWGNAHGPVIETLHQIQGSAPQANFDGPN